ncbi:unnamed protein product [Dicrocoelium dendriticum]|nr:unnamed protein product [Dicrocoelium dendriticum]
MKYRLTAMKFPSKCLLLFGIEITGVLLKDGNPLPIRSELELEDHPTAGQFEDVCIKRPPSVMGMQVSCSTIPGSIAINDS